MAEQSKGHGSKRERLEDAALAALLSDLTIRWRREPGAR
jgi:hypothetical protein